MSFEGDFILPAKYHCLSAELKHPLAENTFATCVERGIGVQSHLTFAAQYYGRPAEYRDPDRVNNIGFCLEQGHRIDSEMESAEYFQFVHGHSHPESE
jgi:TPR repeat protein